MPVKTSSLFGKYVIESIDGEAAKAHATAEFRDCGYGKVCLCADVANVIRGELKDEDHTLKGPVISTMMMGTEAQMLIERILGEGFEEGMKYTVNKGKVTLTSSTHTIALKAE